MKKDLCGKDETKEVVLFGPSAPLYPGPFFECGVMEVMGTRTLDPEQCSPWSAKQGDEKNCISTAGRKWRSEKK